MKERTEAGATSPAVVFMLLLALLGAVVGGAIWAGQIDGQPIPPAPVTTPKPTEDQSLTDAEAIARFKELDALRIRAFEERNARLLDGVFVGGSSDASRARRTIARLRKDGVLMEHAPYRTRELTVLEKGASRIEVQQTVLFHIVFRNEAGRRVRQVGVPEILTLVWTLENPDGKWLISSGEVTGAKRFRSK